MAIKPMISRVIAVMLSLGLAACGGGGSGSGTSGDSGGAVTGFSVPTEISAVPTNQAGGNSKQSLKSKLLVSKAATDPETDYSNAQTTKFVEEHALEQFGIVEDIMKSLSQTHYADTENINQGPYKAMVAQPGEHNGTAEKQLQPWVVDSTMIVENGQDVNRVQVWIDDVNKDGTPRTIKAEFKIFASATKKADGSYQDYGGWNMNAGLGATDSFTASAAVGANGEAIIKIHEISSDNGGSPFETKGILNKSDASGFGTVVFPDWSSCNSPNCTPTLTEAQYVYDADHLAVQTGSDPVQFKDRNTVTDMTHQYGMYDSVTGQDVTKVKSFGFPVRYTDGSGVQQYAYYGAWQGQHQLWANGVTVPAGTVVTREDRNSNQTAESYTVSQPFIGTLVKRTLVTADIGDILNIPVETFVNVSYNLQWDGTNWIDCQNLDFNTFPPACGAGSSLITDFSFLVANPNDHRKFIGINHWDNNTQTNTDLMYDPNGGSGAGFYVATRDSMGNLTNTGTLFTPSGPGDQLFANIGGSIYIMYNGTGWVEKTVLSFDETTWTTTFDPTGDKAYTPDLNREYYINNQGANYVVKLISAGPDVYDVQIELQSVANPVNVTTFLAAGAYFKPQWDNGSGVSYQFVTDSASPNFLKLVYKSVGTQPGVNIGDVVTGGQWGLMAFDSNDASTGVQFNWNYPSQGQTFGTLTYLIDGAGAYKLLDDPIRLAPVTLTNNAGQSKTLALQFDGWMGGLPDLYQDLQKNNFVMTADIAGKAINISAGTLVTDAVDSTKSYLIKPLEMSEFLNLISDPGNLDLALANAIDLSTVPTFVDPNMGAMPTTTGVKYSEGSLVQ